MKTKFRYITITRKDRTTQDTPVDQRKSTFVVQVNAAVPFNHRMLK